jgi:NAD(P)-dependent dehydrogenase (short-subunit alcohol dehydrogenase family)
MGTLNNKVAICAGGATNMGAATARLMAEEGAKVVIADLNITDAEKTAAEIREKGGDAIAFKMDISSESDVQAMVRYTVEKFGGVDVLFNSIAATGAMDSAIGIDYSTDIVNLDIAVYDHTMEINLRGSILTIRAAVPEMLKRGGGSIINTSSVASLGGNSRGHAYAISKAGINALTQGIAAAYGPQKIRCNAIVPAGILRTENIDTSRPPVIPMDNKPGPRTGTPQEVANLVVFLASDETSSYINGQLIQIDGGPTGRGPVET